MDPSKEPGVVIAQVFVEKIAFSHREGFLALPANTPPNVGEIAVNVMIGESADGESGLIRIEVKTNPENKPTYNVELTMVALVQRAAIKNMTVEEFLTSGASVSLLYPFLREAFANVTQRGRFGPVWLNPINTQDVAEKLRARGPTQVVNPPMTEPSQPGLAAGIPEELPKERRKLRRRKKDSD